MLKYLLLNTTDLMKVLQEAHVLIGMGLAIIGIAIAILSKRIARAVRQTRDLREDDKIVLSLKTIGLVFALVALVFVAWGTNLAL